MTIHASKGLEFPVVFLAGGFTQGRTPSYLTYRADGVQVFNLDPNEQAGKVAYQHERDGEERRLHYVALTRPMFKLYVPLLAVQGKSYKRPGPLVTILAPAASPGQTWRRWAARVSSASTRRPRSRRPSSHRSRRASAAPVVPAWTKLAELFPRIDPNLARRRIRIRSFSSLHRSALAAAEPRYEHREPRGHARRSRPAARPRVRRDAARHHGVD